DDTLALFNAVVAGNYIPPKDLVPNLPRRVEKAIEGALQPDLSERIPDCHTLMATLTGDIVTKEILINKLPEGPWNQSIISSVSILGSGDGERVNLAAPRIQHQPISEETWGPEPEAMIETIRQPTQADMSSAFPSLATMPGADTQGTFTLPEAPVIKEPTPATAPPAAKGDKGKLAFVGLFAALALLVVGGLATVGVLVALGVFGQPTLTLDTQVANDNDPKLVVADVYAGDDDDDDDDAQPEPEPDNNATPEPAPPEAGAGSTKHDDAETTQPDKIGLGGCGQAEDLEAAASKGALSSYAQQCIAKFIVDDESQKMTDRRKLSRLQLVNDKAICDASKQCAAYEESQTYYFEELGRYDVDMMLIWVRYLSDNKAHGLEQQNDIVLWCNRALERRQDWTSEKYVSNVEKLFKERSQARYSMVKLSSGGEQEKYRTEARTDIMEWANFRLQLGKDAEEALALCALAVGDRSRCTAQQHEMAAKVQVTFVSVPLGAKVLIDGNEIAQAPFTHDITGGQHVVRMEMPDGKSTDRNIQVGPNDPTRHLWRAREDKWESTY
ncbi:MAG: PEGA domain-containing protein, partial [Proteobacteria bacterium]|nr:PEGA domain-containing protein [Pseudomonadota bacterium]